jgi:hypothetical protein
MKTLLIFGSRTLEGEPVIDAIEKAVDKYKPQSIATALNPRGVCEQACKWIRQNENGITFIGYALDKKRAQGKHEARSMKAISEADFVLFIWDGKSKGTSNEITIARNMRKPFEIVTIKPDQKQHEDVGIVAMIQDLINQ